MRCPKCNAVVDKDRIICENCGMKLNRQVHREPIYETVTDDGVVFLSSNTSSRRGFSKNKVLAVILSVLAVCGIAAGIIVYIVSNKEPDPEPSGAGAAVQTTAADTTQPQTLGETTAPAATKANASKASEAKSSQDKLEDYIASSSVKEDILAESDGDMTLSVFAENNILVAQYTVPVDNDDPEQSEYISTLDGYFSDLAARLDKVLYDLKSKSGVEDAELEVRAYDRNGVSLYAETIS